MKTATISISYSTRLDVGKYSVLTTATNGARSGQRLYHTDRLDQARQYAHAGVKSGEKAGFTVTLTDRITD